MGTIPFDVITFSFAETFAVLNGNGLNLASEVDPGILTPPMGQAVDVFDPRTEQLITIKRGDTILEVFDIEWAVGTNPPTPQEIINALAQDADILPVSARYLTINPDNSGQLEIIFTIRDPVVQEVAVFTISGIVIAGTIAALTSFFTFLGLKEIRKTAEVAGGAAVTVFSVGFFIAIAIGGLLIARKIGVRF